MVALGPGEARGAGLEVVTGVLRLRLEHAQVANLQDLLGELVDSVVAGEADLAVVLLAARVIVPDPVHHFQKDVLAVHQLVVVPLGPVVHVLVHEVRVGLDVGDLQVQVVLELLEGLHLGEDVLVHAGLEIVCALLE